MMLRQRPRGGMTAVECSLVYPILFLLLLGLAIGGLGMFRYQEVAALAREGARWASVHGAQFAHDTSGTAATPADVYNTAIAPKAAGLDLTQLTYTVTWDTDNHPYHTTIVAGNVVAVQNTVSVTVTYQWIPEAYLGGVTLTSTSVLPMSY